MISLKHKFIFIHIPKCGGTTINETLGLVASTEHTKGTNGHGNMHYHEPLLKKGYFCFSFTRNPFKRVCSLYHFFNTDKCMRWSQNRKTHELIKKLSFKEFVMKLSEFKYDQHFTEQYKFLSHPIYKVNFIGKVETMQQDFNIICDKLGIPQQQLPHKNKTKHKHYTEYYDDETRQIVAEKYTRDIEVFGYKFGE